MSVELVSLRLLGHLPDWSHEPEIEKRDVFLIRRSKMEMLKTIWNYALDVGNELVPKKRYALLLGVAVGAIAVGWWMY